MLGCVEAADHTNFVMQITLLNISYVADILLNTKFLFKSKTEYKRLSNEN